MTALWTAWRLQRFEIIFVGIAGLILATVAGYALSRLIAFGTDPTCVSVFTDGGSPEGLPPCPGLTEYLTLQSSTVRALFIAFSLVPVAAGAIIGGPLVAREIDQRTAELSWAVAASRVRWLLGRVVPIAIVVLLFSLGIGMLAEAVEAARAPHLDSSASFLDYGTRGPLLAARTASVLTLSILVGAIIGRVLPAVLLSAVVGGAVLIFAPLPAYAVAARHELASEDGVAPATAAYAQTMWRNAEGELLSESAARDLAPNPDDPDGTIAWLQDNFEYVQLVIDGSEMPGVAAREAGIHGGLVLLALGLTAVVVHRRRPY